MSDTKKSEKETGESSEHDSVGVEGNTPWQNYTDNFMTLMKDWYAQSSEMLQFMLKSFSRSAGDNPGKSEKNSSEENKHRETLWNGYVENMEKVMKDLTGSYGFDQKQMEEIYNRWKEFQNSMAAQFNIDNESGPNLGISPEVWSKWFEYANTMNQQLFECFYDQEPKPGTTSPFSTLAGSTIHTGIPCDNISQLDEQSLNEMNDIVSRFYADITKEYMAANEAVMFNKESAADKSQDFLAKWTTSYDKFMKELIRTRAFNVILNDNLKQSLDAKKQLDDTLENQWKLLGLPTRNDLMELHRTLHDLQLKLNRLHKDFKEFDIKTNSKKSK